MKLQIALLTTIAAALVSNTALAIEAPSYRYDPKQGKCLNLSGVKGYNNSYKGECGELWGAELKEANFSKANLSGANLPRANLTGANLSGANLAGANLMMTKLKDSKLEGALFNERTILPFDRKEAEKRGMIFVPLKETPTKKASL